MSSKSKSKGLQCFKHAEIPASFFDLDANTIKPLSRYLRKNQSLGKISKITIIYNELGSSVKISDDKSATKFYITPDLLDNVSSCEYESSEDNITELDYLSRITEEDELTADTAISTLEIANAKYIIGWYHTIILCEVEDGSDASGKSFWTIEKNEIDIVVQKSKNVKIISTQFCGEKRERELHFSQKINDRYLEPYNKKEIDSDLGNILNYICDHEVRVPYSIKGAFNCQGLTKRILAHVYVRDVRVMASEFEKLYANAKIIKKKCMEIINGYFLLLCDPAKVDYVKKKIDELIRKCGVRKLCD